MNLDKINNKLGAWSDQIIEMLPNLALAIIVLALFYFIGRYARNLVKKFGYKLSDNRAVSNLFGLFTQIGFILLGVIIGLQIMNLDGAAFSVLAGAGIAGIALGFALQDIAANFISGTVLALQRPMKIGDLVETHETYGIVRKINLRSTEIETLQGQLVHIPNKDILLNPMIDYSHGTTRRVDIEVGVSYRDDLDKVKKVALKAINSIKGIDNKKPVDMYFSEFGDSSINFVIRFWVPFKKETDYLSMRSQAVMNIKKSFDSEGITIPFPIRTLELAEYQKNMLKNL